MNYALTQWRYVQVGHTVMGGTVDETVAQIEQFTVGMHITFDSGSTLAVHEHDHIFVATAHRRRYEHTAHHTPILTRHARIT